MKMKRIAFMLVLFVCTQLAAQNEKKITEISKDYFENALRLLHPTDTQRGRLRFAASGFVLCRLFGCGRSYGRRRAAQERSCGELVCHGFLPSDGSGGLGLLSREADALYRGCARQPARMLPRRVHPPRGTHPRKGTSYRLFSHNALARRF